MENISLLELLSWRPNVCENNNTLYDLLKAYWVPSLLGYVYSLSILWHISSTIYSFIQKLTISLLQSVFWFGDTVVSKQEFLLWSLWCCPLIEENIKLENKYPFLAHDIFYGKVRETESQERLCEKGRHFLFEMNFIGV